MNESRFDISSDPGGRNDSEGQAAAGNDSDGNPFLGIRFKCCKTYGRIYRNKTRSAYEGKCPKCFARISVPIGNGGTSSRFFNAG